MTPPDYSAWLTPERLAVEEVAWTDPARATWPVFVDFIKARRGAMSMFSVIEFGCGTGLVAAGLPDTVTYHGEDANAECVLRARARNDGRPRRTFAIADVRAAWQYVAGKYELACAFSFLKHFGLHEWDTIVERVLRPGRMGLFSVPVSLAGDRDEGLEFPHVWVTATRVERAVRRAGHEVRSWDALPWGETMVTTRLLLP